MRKLEEKGYDLAMIRRSMTHIALCLTIASSFAVRAESVLDDEVDSAPTEATTGVAAQLITEKIQKISESQKIFIITNTNGDFGKGDFITLVLENELVARAICAKQIDNLAGIKIVKIYSNDLWQKLHSGMDVQIIRGDDSFWKSPKKKDEKDKDDSKIKDEDDLYNETRLEDDTTFDENKNRAIKPDNIVSLHYGWIDGKNNDGSSAKIGQYMGSWSYQLTDNAWGEVSYGQGIMNDYPSPGLDTKVTNLTLRAKYAVTGPMYSFLLPYIGYQMINANSPGAGVEDSTSNMTTDDYAAELDRVDDLKKNTIVFGVTALKRIVPGWFLRADLGTDTLAVGASLEF